MCNYPIAYRTVTVMCCLAFAQGAGAEPVELQSLDGLISVRGEILDYDGEKIKIESALGVVDVPSRQMRCLSENCPTDIAWAVTEENITIALQDEGYQSMLDKLSATYATQLGGGIENGEDGAFTINDANDVLKLNIGVAGPDALDSSDLAIRSFSANQDVVAELDSAVDWAVDAQPDAQIFATGALAVIVASDVELDAISVEDVARIYAGDVTNWSELGGADLAIMPLKREPGSDAIRDFSEIVMKPNGLEVAPAVLTVGSDERLVETVEQFPGSMAVIDIASAELSSKLPLRGQCGAIVAPTPFALKSGDYPLLRPVLVEAQSEIKSGLVSSMFDLAASASWQADLVSAGFVDQSIMIQSPDEKSGRVNAIMASDITDDQQESARAMVETLFGSSRLSVTFQDNAITPSIAAWNRSGLVRLQETLESGAYADSEILFVGFSNEDDALASSQASADDIMEAFQAFAPQYGGPNAQGVILSSVGYGALSPVSCHNGPLSSVDSNRVEIWVRPISG